MDLLFYNKSAMGQYHGDAGCCGKIMGGGATYHVVIIYEDLHCLVM